MVLLALLGRVLALGSAFWFSLLLSGVGWIWQYLKLRQPHIPRSVYGKILGQNVWLGFILLTGMILGFIV